MKRDASFFRSLISYRSTAAGVIVATVLTFLLLRKPVSAPAVSAQTTSRLAVTDDSTRWDRWLTDFGSATSAAESGRDILVEFASAQEGPAPLETLLQDRGLATVGAHYVLVRLDVATSKSDAQTVEKTAEWIDKLNLTELPCLVLFDSAFRPFGVVKGGDSATAGDLLARLHTLDASKVRRDVDLAAAATAVGLDRAKLLDKALDDVGPVAELAYPEVMQQIVKLDPEGTAGLKPRYAARVSEQLVDDGIQHIVYPLVDSGDLQGALDQASRLEHGVATTVAQRQLLQAFEAQLYSSLGQQQKAIAMMDGAIALDPSTDAASRIRSEKSKILTARRPEEGSDSVSP